MWKKYCLPVNADGWGLAFSKDTISRDTISRDTISRFFTAPSGVGGWGFGVFGIYYFPGGHEVRAFISKSYYFLCAKIISRAFLLSCNLIRNKTTRRQAGQPPERFKPCPSARVTSPKYGKFSRHTWKTRNCANPRTVRHSGGDILPHRSF